MVRIVVRVWRVHVSAAAVEKKRQAREHGASRWTFRKRIKLFVDSLLGFSMVHLRLI